MKAMRKYNWFLLVSLLHACAKKEALSLSRDFGAHEVDVLP